MANTNDTLFSINAGKILATLHLAAITLAPDYKPIYNTGLKDCSDGDTPEKPGKSTFDFNNKGLYEIGFIKEITYNEVINLDINKNLQKAEKELKNKKNDQKLTDDNKGVNDKREAVNELKRLLTGAKSKETEKLDEEIKTIIEKRKEDKEKAFAEFKKQAFTNIKLYIETFSGKENASKLKEDEIIVSMLDKPIKSLKDIQVKAYKIQDSITDKKIASNILKSLEDKFSKATKVDDFTVTQTFCYKIGYAVESETM